MKEKETYSLIFFTQQFGVFMESSDIAQSMNYQASSLQNHKVMYIPSAEQ